MSVFDGMATTITGVLGAPVTIVPTVGSEFTVSGVFRSEPLGVLDEDGRGTLILSPTFKLPAAAAALVSVGDEVRPTDGNRYLIVNGLPMGSPASDAFHMFELELALDV